MYTIRRPLIRVAKWFSSRVRRLNVEAHKKGDEIYCSTRIWTEWATKYFVALLRIWPCFPFCGLHVLLGHECSCGPFLYGASLFYFRGPCCVYDLENFRGPASHMASLFLFVASTNIFVAHFCMGPRFVIFVALAMCMTSKIFVAHPFLGPRL